MPLPFARSASQTRPTFSRDFSGLKTLDHGTGPAITFTRASDATFFDANGDLQTAANNVARFDHSQDGAANSLGLLIEEARTNSIRNSQGGGSTNGVIGSGGVAPTNWGITANANGVTSEIIGTGTEDGFSYIDIKLSGTPTATSEVITTFEPATAVVAANAQTWTQSAYFKLSGGTTANAQVYVELRARTTGGLFISGQNVSTEFTPTSASLKSQRHNVILVTSDATVGRMLPMTRVAYTNGNPIDLTLRIAAPQLELGAFPTSYIPTTAAAATRSADSAVVTPIASFYNQSEGTLFAEVQENADALYGIVSVDGDSSTDRIDLRRPSSSVMRLLITASSAEQASINPALVLANQALKMAGAFKANDAAVSLNGAASLTDSSVNLPSVTHFRIGALGGTPSTTATNGHIRKVAYFPKRLTNTLLEQLTT